MCCARPNMWCRQSKLWTRACRTRARFLTPSPTTARRPALSSAGGRSDRWTSTCAGSAASCTAIPKSRRPASPPACSAIRRSASPGWPTSSDSTACRWKPVIWCSPARSRAWCSRARAIRCMPISATSAGLHCSLYKCLRLRPLGGGARCGGGIMSVSEAAAASGSIGDVVARIERLPVSWWHVKTRIIIGVATFFDAFDALAIAFVLPVLVPAWKLAGPQIGLLISAGYLGQLAGALFFGWIAERYGRVKAMVWSILIFAVMSLACALAWDYHTLVVARIIQGFGLGGEVPVAAAYISELARAKGRG